MKTQIKKNGDTIVVSMTGKLNFEGQAELKDNLKGILKTSQRDSAGHQIVFNFSKLEFVGSMGISTFVQTLKDFSERSSSRPRYCHVGSEFQKIIKAYDEAHIFEFFSDETTAISSFESSTQTEARAEDASIPTAKIPTA